MTDDRLVRLAEAYNQGDQIRAEDVVNLLMLRYEEAATERGVHYPGEEYEAQKRQEAEAQLLRKVTRIIEGYTTKRELGSDMLIAYDAMAYEAGMGRFCLLTERIPLAEAVVQASDYLKSLRSGVRGLWSGVMTEGDFYHSMEPTLERYLRQAWYRGIARCGFKPDEMSVAEVAEMNEFIYKQFPYLADLAAYVLAHSKALKGKLKDVYKRLDLWAGRWSEAVQRGQAQMCKDQKAMWVLGQAEHCFPAGTMITMAYGPRKPIEEIQFGEAVMTAVGVGFVTEIYQRNYRGPRVLIQCEGKEVIATHKHRFLTQRGWVRAKELERADTLIDAFGEPRTPLGWDGVQIIEGLEGMVYNLEVAPLGGHPLRVSGHDPLWDVGPDSYIANGFVVHNCSSCLKLAGKVKRMSWWHDNGILPRVANAPYLACHGYKCACSLELTDAPLSKGRMPSLP